MQIGSSQSYSLLARNSAKNSAKEESPAFQLRFARIYRWQATGDLRPTVLVVRFHDRLERETGLEPATAWLEGIWL